MNKALYELSRELRLHYEEAGNYKALWIIANDELEAAKSKYNQLELVLSGKALVSTFVKPALAPVPHAPVYGQCAIVNGVSMYTKEAMMDYAKTNVKVQNYAFELHLKALSLSTIEPEFITEWVHTSKANHMPSTLHDHSLIVVKFRDGNTNGPRHAICFTWSQYDCPEDIVAYRLVEPNGPSTQWTNPSPKPQILSE